MTTPETPTYPPTTRFTDEELLTRRDQLAKDMVPGRNCYECDMNTMRRLEEIGVSVVKCSECCTCYCADHTVKCTAYTDHGDPCEGTLEPWKPSSIVSEPYALVTELIERRGIGG